MTTLTIGKRSIGPGHPAFIIAEIGSNHDQKLDQAKKLIEAAAAAGADAVKFQLFKADALYPKDSPVHAILKSIELSRDWLASLARHAAERGVECFASPFDLPAVDALETAGASAYKVASSEVTNLPLVKYMASKKKPVLLSTGMCDLADVYEAVEVIRSEGNEQILIFQCTSLYPLENRHIHLRAMQTLASTFQCPVGLSDHTLGTLMPSVAVAMGACSIEKHLTLSRKLKGPDHGYALEPEDFKRMISQIREVEEALGSPKKTLLAEEAVHARRESLHAARALSAGSILEPCDIVVQRPAGGIRPRYLPAVLGARLKKSLAKGDTLSWEVLEIPTAGPAWRA
ncbi:MAG: N-acetylneuraminate synthase family protein [Elusimicrobiota bacterium]